MPTKGDQYKAVWQELNERQREYLKAVYTVDQEKERAEKQRWTVNRQRARPAEQWRWMNYHPIGLSDRSRLQDALGHTQIDAGTGSTFNALESRGLVDCRYKGSARYQVLEVQITPLGRAVYRANDPDYKPVKKLPTGTLNRTQWQALEALYNAGDEGLTASLPGDYGKFSWMYVWLRLRDYRQDGKEYPLMEEHYSYTTITDNGRAYYEANKDRYKALYPDD